MGVGDGDTRKDDWIGKRRLEPHRHYMPVNEIKPINAQINHQKSSDLCNNGQEGVTVLLLSEKIFVFGYVSQQMRSSRQCSAPPWHAKYSAQ